MPDRKQFYEAINEQLRNVVTQLIEEFPELQGAAIALTYTPELGDVPACLVIGDLHDPHMICRMGLQTAKLQAMVLQGVSQHIVQAMEAHTRLKQETDAKREDKDPPSPKEAEGSGDRTGQFGRAPDPPQSN